MSYSPSCTPKGFPVDLRGVVGLVMVEFLDFGATSAL